MAADEIPLRRRVARLSLFSVGLFALAVSVFVLAGWVAHRVAPTDIIGQLPFGPEQAYQPPADLDLISYVAHFSGPVEHKLRTTLLIKPGRAAGIRRWAEPIGSGPDGDRFRLSYSDARGIAGWIVRYGADVQVLEPEEVRSAVIERLLELTKIHGESTAGVR